MLRKALLAGAALLFAAALAATILDPQRWTLLAFAALLLAGVAFERFGYGGSAAPTGGWRRTGECFHDVGSGALVRVWFHPATGARRYVVDGEAPPG